jgi:hypothetical protein
MKKPPVDPEDLAGGVPRLAIYYAEHPEEYGDLIDDMLDRRLLTLNDWREFIECMTAEQQNRMIREFLKVGSRNSASRPERYGYLQAAVSHPVSEANPEARAHRRTGDLPATVRRMGSAVRRARSEGSSCVGS